MTREIISSIPVTLRPGMSDDEKLLAAWEGVSTDQILWQLIVKRGRPNEKRDVVFAARRRVIALREAGQ